MNTHVIAAPAMQSRTTVVFTCVLAALAGLMFGLDIGVISGATQFIQNDFSVSDHVIEWIVSSMMFGAAVGAVGASWLSAALGRKRSLILGAVLFVLGSLLSGLAWSPDTLIAARLVLGLAIGVATFTAPLYLAEVAPERIRGAMISTYQLMITIGILVAFLSDTALSYTGAWRWMLGVIAIPGALFLLGVLLLPDSPRWLMMRGRRDEAIGVLRRLRGDEAVVLREAADIEEQLRTPQRGWHLFLENRNFRRSVGLGVLLQLMQQFTGMNVVMYYAPRIFQTMGYDTAAQMWFTALVGLTNVLATFIAIALIDRWGRKPILYTGFAVMAAGLGVVGAMMHGGIGSHAEQIFTVAMLLMFIVGFAMSAGPLVWTLCSEIQPLKGRDFGIGCSTFTNWIANMIVGATFLSLLNGIGNAHTFWLYASLNILFIGLTLWLVPETKGVTLEQIERNLMHGKPLREIGR
ncbi:D-galactose transporter GalP [Rhodanobacter sp. FW510-R12]|uniref:sugar porter family MFS transporter n=1 Tax=unclassified Rhodanobacter TaxID=2621553 RepID=UPI0007AA0435|nr:MULTISPECIES: sugar porter family MFS transporter [unclassified Rhodanobacter]KZC17737.1 D-galactose transporter GalP [Rhodanobacter sp. FW104-R8]KZC27999.1 D-galactose transporter GalP [Rhodanobacter sp. FW510-T8]KZC29899.1 D-galactose transporter GalP [Rhodanobacter sp. FW510-R10]